MKNSKKFEKLKKKLKNSEKIEKFEKIESEKHILDESLVHKCVFLRPCLRLIYSRAAYFRGNTVTQIKVR